MQNARPLFLKSGHHTQAPTVRREWHYKLAAGKMRPRKCSGVEVLPSEDFSNPVLDNKSLANQSASSKSLSQR